MPEDDEAARAEAAAAILRLRMKTKGTEASAPPPMLPLRRERFFTAQAAQDRNKKGIADQKERERLDKSAALSYDADFARWSSLPASQKGSGGFMDWVNDQYAGRTQDEAKRYTAAGLGKFKGREKASLLKKMVRGLEASAGGTDIKDGEFSGMPTDLSGAIQQTMNPMTGVRGILGGIQSLLPGDNTREQTIKKYMEMRTPVQDRSIGETVGDLGTAFNRENIGGTLRSMLNPGDALATAAGFIPVGGEAGVVSKLAGLAKNAGAKGGRLATVLPRVGKAARIVGAPAKALATPTGGVAMGGLAGGGINAAVDEQGDPTRAFTAGLVPGFLMGGAGEVGRAGVKALADWKGYDPNAPAPVDPNAAPVEPMPWQKDVHENRIRRADAAGRNPVEESISIEDIAGSNEVWEAMSKTRLDREAQEFLKQHAKDVVPDMPENLPLEDQKTIVHGRLKKIREDMAAKAEAEKVAAAPPVPAKPLTKAQQIAHDKKIAEAKAIHSIPAGLDETTLAGMTDAQIKDAVKANVLLNVAGEDVSGYHDFGTYQEGVAARDAAKLKVNGERPDPKAKIESDRNAADVDAALDVFNMKPHQGESFRIDKARAKKIRSGLIADDGRLSQRLAQEGYAPSDITELMTLAKNTDAMSDDAIAGILTGKPLWAEPELTKLDARNATYREINNKETAQAIGSELNARDAADAANAKLDQAAQQTLQGQTDELLRSEAEKVRGEERSAQESQAIRDQVSATDERPVPAQSEEDAARSARVEKMVQSKPKEAVQAVLYSEILKDPAKAELFGIDRDLAIDAADSKSPFTSHSQKELKTLLIDKADEVKRTGLPKGFM